MTLRRLFPHQKSGLAWALKKKEPRYAFFWEMRLGKTLMTIRLIERERHFPCLIVSPLSVLGVWQDELAEEGHASMDLHDLKMRKRLLEDGEHLDWNLVNYDALRNNPDLCHWPWACVVLDESPAIRNPQTQISRVCTSRFSHVPAKVILSGYPSPEGLENLVQQFIFLRGEFMGHRNYWTWRSEFMERAFWGYGWQPKKGTVQAIKEAIKRHSSVLRRKDLGVGPRLVESTRYCELPPEMRSEYRKMERDFAGSDGQTTKYKPVVDMWLRQLSCGPHKDRILFEVLDTELRKEKVVVWFAFNEDLRRIRRLLKKRKRAVWSITGATPSSERKISIGRWSKSGTGILLCNVACGKYGLNFSAADTAIYYSKTYSGDAYRQSRERIAHLAKTGQQVLLLHLTTRDTIEEDVEAVLAEKHLLGGESMRPIWKRFLERKKR